MKLRLLLGVFVFVGGTMVALQSASAKDKKSTQEAKKHKHDGHDHAGHDHAGHDHAGHDHDGHDMGGMDPEAMARWTKAMTPGEHHGHLAQHRRDDSSPVPNARLRRKIREMRRFRRTAGARRSRRNSPRQLARSSVTSANARGKKAM